MELKDYTTTELLKELLRRSEAASASNGRSTAPVYETIIGTVSRVQGIEGPFARRRFEVEISDEDSEKLSVPKKAFYKLLGGKFRKDSHPQVGDKVSLRCRITKMCPAFTQKRALLTDITERHD